jgi:hypothetical protein
VEEDTQLAAAVSENGDSPNGDEASPVADSGPQNGSPNGG